MITPGTTLAVRPTDVVHETVDGEVVIVDLSNGVYFSTDGVGAAVWGALASGTTLERLAEWAQSAFPGEPNAAEEVSQFVQQLYAQKLVEESSSEPNGAPDGVPGSYATPNLQAFNDMESLLLLDPIHDVGPETSWPEVG